MLYKIFYSLLMGISPWMASTSLPTVLAQSSQVQVIETKKDEATLYLQKEQEVKKSVAALALSNEDVLRQFDLFSQALKEGIAKGAISEKDAEEVLGAVTFAAQKHKTQYKSDPKKTPYIIHPLEVAERVAKVGQVYDKDTLIAALLHDVLDDAVNTEQEISDLYGKKVAGYVTEMTAKKGVSLKEQKKDQIMKAFHQTPAVAIIKYSDKLSNLETLATTPPSNWTRDRIDQYFQWAQSVIENLPDANPQLKKQVKEVIANYWEKQQQIKKS